MAIKINDIPPEGLTLTLAHSVDLADQGSLTNFTATLTITPTGNNIFHVSGSMEATPELECSKCLKRFRFPVKEPSLNFDLVPEGSLQIGAEHELKGSELDMEFYQGSEIEPRDFIREQILLAIPMVPVHSPDCKGLCPVCGLDRNINTCGCNDDTIQENSPFAVLKRIIKPEKE